MWKKSNCGWFHEKFLLKPFFQIFPQWWRSTYAVSFVIVAYAFGFQELTGSCVYLYIGDKSGTTWSSSAICLNFWLYRTLISCHSKNILVGVKIKGLENYVKTLWTDTFSSSLAINLKKWVKITFFFLVNFTNFHDTSFWQKNSMQLIEIKLWSHKKE